MCLWLLGSELAADEFHFYQLMNDTTVCIWWTVYRGYMLLGNECQKVILTRSFIS